jgi:hypothetical protein
MLQANPFTTWTLLISWLALGVCIAYALALRKRVIESRKQLNWLLKATRR